MTRAAWIALGAVVALLALWGAYSLARPFLPDWKARAKVAEQGQTLAKDTTRIIERTMTHENTVYRDAEKQADAIQTLPGADAPVPDELLSSWGRAIDGMREQSKAPVDHGS